jgi:Chlorophyll A-B binding protein
MLATLGFIITEFVKLPGDVHAVNSVLAHNAAVNSGSAFQVLTAIAGIEFISCIALKEMFEGSGRAPGDFSFDPLGLSAKLDQKNKDIMALKELENGRLAMVAFSGIVTQAVITQHGFPYI